MVNYFMNRMLYPQEIEVFYIIPSLKRQLSMYMKLNGLKQSEVADLLQIDKATVSQYISKKRGSTVEFDEDTLNEIAKSAKIIKDQVSLVTEIQRLLNVSKKNKTLCKVHQQVCNGFGNCTEELQKMCLRSY